MTSTKLTRYERNLLRVQFGLPRLPLLPGEREAALARAADAIAAADQIRTASEARYRATRTAIVATYGRTDLPEI